MVLNWQRNIGAVWIGITIEQVFALLLPNPMQLKMSLKSLFVCMDGWITVHRFIYWVLPLWIGCRAIDFSLEPFILNALRMQMYHLFDDGNCYSTWISCSLIGIKSQWVFACLWKPWERGPIKLQLKADWRKWCDNVIFKATKPFLSFFLSAFCDTGWHRHEKLIQNNASLFIVLLSVLLSWTLSDRILLPNYNSLQIYLKIKCTEY